MAAVVGGGGFGGGGGGSVVAAVGRPGGGGGAAAAAQAESGDTGHVQASADERTNTVVVSGPPDTLAVIDGVLTQLDSNPIADQDFFIYRVKNGQAVDMASTLNGLFSGTPATQQHGQPLAVRQRYGQPHLRQRRLWRRRWWRG